jgi:hypothetical protein
MDHIGSVFAPQISGSPYTPSSIKGGTPGIIVFWWFFIAFAIAGSLIIADRNLARRVVLEGAVPAPASRTTQRPSGNAIRICGPGIPGPLTEIGWQ